MATWDFGGGCACGVSKVCDCKHNKQSDGSVARPEEKKTYTMKDIADIRPTKSSNINYKYREKEILADLSAYLDRTYGEHYNQNDENVQCFDAWLSRSGATDTFVNTAMKYLWRYGKKNGNNKEDLMKTLHYVFMALYSDHYRRK